MKRNNVLMGLLCLASAAVFTACGLDDNPPYGNGKGRIQPNIGLNPDAVTAKNVSRSSASITAADLTLRLTKTDGSYSHTWNPGEAFPVDQDFVVGDYLFEAFYGNVNAQEGFDCPYFYGSQTITVADSETTEVNFTAALANSMVSVDFTEEFKMYMTDWSSQVHSTGGQYIAIAKDETRPAYVLPGTVALTVSLTEPSGKTASLEVASFSAVAQHHYHVTVGLNNGAGNTKVLNVSFDDTVNQEDIDIELSDELMNAPAPTVTAKFDNEATIFQVLGQDFSDDLAFDVIAKGGLTGLTLTTESESLIAKGWPAEINLIGASAAEQAALKSLGFEARGVWGNVDKMAVVNFRNVLKNIDFRASGNNETVFTLKAKDRFGKVSEPVSFTVSLDRMRLEVSNPAQWVYAQTTVSFDVYFNGSNISNVAIQYKNDRGTWSNATVVSREALAQKNTYTFTVKVPEGMSQITLRATAADLVSENLSFEMGDPLFKASVNANNVWSKTATIDIIDGTQSASQAMPLISYSISTDGSNFTAVTPQVNGTSVTFNGLTPGTSYVAKASATVDGVTYDILTPFTTEATAQITNGDMETWVQTANGNNWELLYPGASATASVWGTNNPMTTSQGSDLAYCRISGTISTTDAHSGSAAALIRTVGWGSGNTAVGSGGGSGNTKYVDAGLLHIGSSRSTRTVDSREGVLTTDDLDCGVAFASRPASLSFWYKYTAKNSSDKGLAYIEVVDAGGNVIASGTTDLPATSTYTEMQINLTYPANCPKAAKIYVKFLSTNDTQFLAKNNNNLSGPGFANLSRGTFMGSQLYIDDIQLNY